MRMKTTISIQVDVVDFIEAADHQREMERLVEGLRQDFPELTHKTGQARANVRADGRMEFRKLKRNTGNLCEYQDYKF